MRSISLCVICRYRNFHHRFTVTLDFNLNWCVTLCEASIKINVNERFSDLNMTLISCYSLIQEMDRPIFIRKSLYLSFSPWATGKCVFFSFSLVIFVCSKTTRCAKCEIFFCIIQFCEVGVCVCIFFLFYYILNNAHYLFTLWCCREVKLCPWI